MSWAGLDDFLARAAARLDPVTGPETLPEGGDIDLVPDDVAGSIRPAAVLIGVLPRQTGPKVLLTTRPKTMPTHAGQVAFPGGKVEQADPDEVAAALREAEEEVGLPVSAVNLVGRGEAYVTGSAFRITPVLAMLPADFEPVPDPTEVDEVFETPLDFLMNPDNHDAREALWQGHVRRYYEMPHNGYRIWGVTAGIIRNLYDRLYSGETEQK